MNRASSKVAGIYDAIQIAAMDAGGIVCSPITLTIN